MRIDERVELYKSLYHGSTAPTIVSKIIADGFYTLTGLAALEAIRRLNTDLSDYYQVSIPVITVWVRDDNYVQATGEIYLTEPNLEGFLHQFRHHLQNIERRYERRGLTAEGADPKYWRVPYEECMCRMPGEDDAKAWAKFVIEVATHQ